MISIYSFTNLINGKVYIGSTNDVGIRLRNHKYHAHTSKKYRHYYIYQAMNKYGWDNFKFEVIEECCVLPIIRNERENYWINFYNTLDKEFGYNMRLADNKVISDDTINKMRQAKLGKKHTDEQNKNKSKIMTGNKRSLGHKHTQQAKDNMGKSHIGSKRSAETKARMSLAQTGKIRSEESKRKQSETRKRLYNAANSESSITFPSLTVEELHI